MADADTLIKEIFGTFKDFIYRDLFYVVGGVAVLLSVSHVFELPFKYTGWTGVYMALLAYVVGYSLQEIWSIFGVVVTSYKGPPKCFIRWAAKRFAPSEDWESLPCLQQVDQKALRNCLNQHENKSIQKDIERTINLKQLCSSMGSSLLTTAIILRIGIIMHPYTSSYTRFYCPLFWGSLVLSLFLVVINRIKLAQESLMKFEVNNLCEKCKGSAIKK